MPTTALIAANWSSQSSWTVLDTGFGTGQAFLQLWQCWKAHGTRPAMLHYVGVLSPTDSLHTLSDALAQPGYGLEPGFQRLLLEDGAVSLTLCIGEPSAMLACQDMQADSVLAAAPVQAWDKWQLKALARCCRLGAQLVFAGPVLPTPALLAEAGFTDIAASDTLAASMLGATTGTGTGAGDANAKDNSTLRAVYQPRWTVRGAPRRASAARAKPAAAAGRCAVIGAGVAGASVAQALALRGWQVDVYDAAAPGGAGADYASSLPLGLVVPHHSVDDSPRSRLSRVGTRLMLAHAQRLLQAGQDWQPGGVLERRDTEHLWHPHAAWIKPVRLVQRWLEHPNIRLHRAITVHSLERLSSPKSSQWLLRDKEGLELGRADRVVFANAFGCVDLVRRMAETLPADFPWLDDVLQKLQALQHMYGTLSLGPSPEATVFPAFPVNGHGSFVSGVPSDQGPHWYAGSTFQSDATLHADLAREHAANFQKLQTLLPAVAQALSCQFVNGQVQAWQGGRCISHDRLPLVGPLMEGTPGAENGADPTLWLCAGMGARGLSFSALCAELLAAWMGGEPLPVENTLARSLSTRRTRRRRKATSTDPTGDND